MADFEDGPEIVLPRGDVTEGVVRIGDTVRRPAQETSAGVAEYLNHLAARGFDRAPRYLGVDRSGRDVLTFVDGVVPGDDLPAWAATEDVLPSVAQLTRALHDASEGFAPSAPMRASVAGRPTPTMPDEPPLFAQRDITPGNTVFRDGLAWGLIDFDLSDWTTRSVDFVNTAMYWVPLADPLDRLAVHRDIDVAARLRIMLDAYGRDAIDVPRLLAGADARFAGSYATMKWNAEHLGGGWARMWAEGVGEKIVRRQQWWASVRDDLGAALAP